MGKNNRNFAPVSPSEQYRQTFLDYLDAAEKCNERREETWRLAALLDLIDAGRTGDRTENTVAIGAGKVLTKYKCPRTVTSIKRLYRRLEAALTVAQEQEKRLWEELSSVTKELDDGRWWWKYAATDNHVMFYGDYSDGQYEAYAERIKSYREELLGSIASSKKPPTPYELESSFRRKRIGLLDLIPFKTTRG